MSSSGATAASLSKTAYKDDAIILAGDVGDTFTAVKLCLRAFRAIFRRVFYVPGSRSSREQHAQMPRPAQNQPLVARRRL